MKNCISHRNLGFSIGLLLVVGYWAVFGASESLAQVAVSKPIEYNSLSNRTLPDPLRPYDQLIDKKIFNTATLKETAGCQSLEAWQPVRITFEQHLRLAPGDGLTEGSVVAVLAIDGTKNCIKVGHPVRLVAERNDSEVYFDAVWFFPTGLANSRPEFAALEETFLVEARRFNQKSSNGAKAETVFVSGRVIHIEMTALGAGTQQFSPLAKYARSLDRDQFQAALNQKLPVVDVRSKERFKSGHVAGAINIPYTLGPAASRLLQYSQFAKTGDTFDLSQLPSDKTKPLVVMGSSQSLEVVRALIVLGHEGYRNVYWFSEGVAYFRNQVWTPPAASKLVTVVTASEIAKMLQTQSPKPFIISVEADFEFEQGSLPGAVNIWYSERKDVVLRTAGMNGAMLKTYGDTFTMPNVPKTTPILITGFGERDWRAYKAALWAKSQGFTTVYWHRDGMYQWRMLSANPMVNFPIVRGPSKVESTGDSKQRSKDND